MAEESNVRVLEDGRLEITELVPRVRTLASLEALLDERRVVTANLAHVQARLEALNAAITEVERLKGSTPP